jgi:hypothetical protein
LIFHPLILALFSASLLTGFMVVYAAVFGAQILRRWDPRSGSDLQLRLERKTYLVSTLLTYVFAAQLLSLALFVFTADRIHGFFVGAMCAAGTLKAGAFGYPALLLKAGNGILAGLWLILNAADTKGFDYPLVRTKYAWLLAASPLILVEIALQGAYFLRLKPDLITSCCSTLFSQGGHSLGSELASLPIGPMKVLFFSSLALSLVLGVVFVRSGRGAVPLGISAAGTLVVSILAIVSFISIYIYELPAHHCPFCLLQAGYHFIGYPIYASLFGGTIAGLGVGVLQPFRKLPSLSAVVPKMQKKLALAMVVCFAALAVIVAAAMAASRLVLPD